MTSTKLVIATLFACAVTKAQTPLVLQATAQETLLHALARVGQDSGLAIGVVQSDDGALCQSVAGIIPDYPSDIFAAFDQIARQADYEVLRLPTVVIFRPIHLSVDTAKAMSFRLPSFPRQTGTMTFMGDVLQGWLQASYDKNYGFVVNNISSPDSTTLTLAESRLASVDQIASQIVNLGSRGMWVLSDDQSLQKAPLKVRIATYSYEENGWALDRLPCSVPSKNPERK